jgi:hypothetical protein
MRRRSSSTRGCLVTMMSALWTLPSVLRLPANAFINPIATRSMGHEHCMCNQCGKIKEKMEWCIGCRRVWYCDKECQL